MFGGFMYRNRVLKSNLIMEFKGITIFKQRISMSIFSQEKHSLNVFPCKINSLFVELKFCAQTKEEKYKCDLNIAW